MLGEYRDVITHMKENSSHNAHFMHVFDKHNELDTRITNAEKGQEILTDQEIETLKKQKLLLKDEAHGILIKYKKEHNL